MVVDLPIATETALKVKADARGLSVDTFVRAMIDRELASPEPSNGAPWLSAEQIEENRREAFGQRESEDAKQPFRDVKGILAKYGPMPTDEEMEENRRDMLRGFAENI